MMQVLHLVWRFLLIASRVGFFVLFFMMALLNSHPVEFNWFVGQTLQVPLIIPLLGAFLLGLLLAGLAFYRFARKAQ